MRPDQGYYDVDVGLPSGGTGLRVMSISDLNNDKLNDLVMINSAGDTVTVYYFDDATLKYSDHATFTLPSGYLVDNVIPTNSPHALQGLIIVASQSDSQGVQST